MVDVRTVLECMNTSDTYTKKPQRHGETTKPRFGPSRAFERPTLLFCALCSVVAGADTRRTPFSETPSPDVSPFPQHSTATRHSPDASGRDPHRKPDGSGTTHSTQWHTRAHSSSSLSPPLVHSTHSLVCSLSCTRCLADSPRVARRARTHLSPLYSGAGHEHL